MNYSEKLKDPRWQKKRLEIMERDGFKCSFCGNDKLTLNVHHIKYEGAEPWDTPSDLLLTICQKCHDYEHELRNGFEQTISIKLGRTLTWDGVAELCKVLDILDESQYQKNKHLLELLYWASKHPKFIDVLKSLSDQSRKDSQQNIKW